MRTKPLILGARMVLPALALCVSGLGTASHAAPPPTLVLYPRTPRSQDDVRALVDLRKKLRADGRFDVLTYDPASASMVRAARDAHRPGLLTGPMTSDADRTTLTRALGAAFFAVVSKSDGGGKADIHLVEAAPSARTWDILAKKTDDAAQAIEDQAADAMQHPPQVAALPAPARPPSAAPPTVVGPLLAVPGPTAAPSVPVARATPSQTAEAPVPAKSQPDVIAVPSPRPPDATETLPVPPLVAVTTTVTKPVPPPPPPASPPPAPGPLVEDLTGIKGQLQQGDGQLAQGNFVGAISLYRDAVNGAPLSTVPRLKLAQAYLDAGMRDKALDEARRALGIAPGSVSVQQFLMQLDAQSGTADGAVARFDAQVSQSPQDPMAHVELGDAFWNNSTLDQAESEYKAAQTLSGVGTPSFQVAAAHLARLYAAQRRYDDSLAALKQAGPTGYALALGIVQSRADTLSSSLDIAQEAFTAGKSTHADFYKAAGDVSSQALRLAEFVIKVTPPAAFKLSHLYRVQATHLLAQQAAVLVDYIETSDPAQSDKASQLGKSSQTEMLMAHAAEQKLGLWGGKQTEARN